MLNIIYRFYDLNSSHSLPQKGKYGADNAQSS